MPTEEIEGMDDLIAGLDDLTLAESQQVLSKALKNAGKLLAEEQEHLAPRDTGKLAANIAVRFTGKTASEAIARIGPTRRVFYAKFQNFGTRYFHRPQHFVERAWTSKKDEVWSIIRFELGQFIDKALRKHSG